MARIRTIKPDFFKDEDLCSLDFKWRLLFEGLWCHADREGRLEDRPARLKVEIFPYDDIDIEEGLKILFAPKKYNPENQPFITRYEANGKRYIQINNFSKHQYPNIKESPSIMPAPCNNSANTLDNGYRERIKGMDNITPSNELEHCLFILKTIPSYPFNKVKDYTFLKERIKEFPTIDPVQLLKNWQAYLTDHPFRSSSSPRSQLRNQFNAAVKYKKHLRSKRVEDQIQRKEGKRLADGYPTI